MAGRKDLHFPPRSLDQAGRQDRKQSQYQICSRPQRRQWVCELEQRAGLPADLKTNPQAFGRSLSIGMRHDQVRAEADEPAHWVRIPVQNRTIDIRGDNFIEPCRAKGSSIKSQNLVALALRQELVARHVRCGNGGQLDISAALIIVAGQGIKQSDCAGDLRGV